MDTIRIIVRSVVVIIIFAAFLEMILPRSDMKRYINLIIGLFVIIAVLNPFLTILNDGISFNVLTNEEQSLGNDTQRLIQNGKSLADAQRRGAAKEYKDQLSRQIAAMASLYQRKQIGGVNIEMVDDAASPEFGAVRKVILHLDTSEDAAKVKNQDGAVGDITVGEIGIELADSNQTDPQNEGHIDLPALREMIADFYGLSAEQIEIR